MRIGCIGPRVYFVNHFPERWQDDDEVLCVDARAGETGGLAHLARFRPEVTLFYRPELYGAESVTRIPGKRMAYLSEPIPALERGSLVHTSETDVRLRAYSRMAWDVFDHRVFYDSGKRSSIEMLNFPIDEYFPLPIDTSAFRPPTSPRARRPIDVCFVGKATPRRIDVLDFLRDCGLRFVWIAHGISGGSLANLFRRSQIVLNVHADEGVSSEPRIYLAAACGAIVVTERLPSPTTFFRGRVREDSGRWTLDSIRGHLSSPRATDVIETGPDLASLSTRNVIDRVMRTLTH